MNDMKTADPELEVIFPAEAIAIRLGELACEIASEKGRWIDLMTEASILPVNKRPRLAIRLFTSN